MYIDRPEYSEVQDTNRDCINVALIRKMPNLFCILDNARDHDQ